MGVEASRQKAEKVVNSTAKTVFLNFLEYADAQPNDIKSTSAFKKMVYAFYKSMKTQPEGAQYLSLVISGKGLGSSFITVGLNFLKTYPVITRISFRASNLTSNEAVSISRFIKTTSTIKELDLSENKIGNDGVSAILKAATGHPKIEALLLDETNAKPTITADIVDLLSAKSNLRILRICPMNFSDSNIHDISEAIRKNEKITVFIYQQPPATPPPSISRILTRNNEIQNIVNEIFAAPWHRVFKKRNDIFKSVKGRRMIEGKTQQIESLKGTKLYEVFAQTHKEAQETAPTTNAIRTGQIRIGTSETIGRRETMEDFTVVNQNFFGQGTLLVGLFDGHGGREASEFVGNNLPAILQKHQDESILKALEDTFSDIQEQIKTWCVYVGTTAVVALISCTNIVIANVGDTRCVLIQNGTTTQLTVDHKPDVPEEKDHIVKNGGYIEQDRVNGMLAVSRALGDGFLGDAINSTPFIHQEQVSGSYKLIFACDGVWDVIDNDKAASIIRTEIDPMLAARKLRDAAFEAGSTDNISVVVVFVTQPDE